MLVNLSDIKMHSIIDYLESKICSYGYGHKVEALRREAKKKTISAFQRIGILKAIVNKLILKVKQYTHESHLITENIHTQNTYYKTLTSRP